MIPFVFIKAIACNACNAELGDVKKSLEKIGYECHFNPLFKYSNELDEGMEKADYCILDACAATRRTQKMISYFIHNLKKVNPDCYIILTGCSAVLKKRGIEIFDEVDKTIANKKKIKDFLGQKIGNNLTNTNLRLEKNSKNPFVLIQNGCNNFCTYCVMPFTKGKPYSTPYKAIIKKIRFLKEKGINEIVLCGIEMASWRDELLDYDFSDLLRSIIDGFGVRVEGLEIHPKHFNSRLIEVLKSDKIHKGISIPIQSGSDRILKLMNRGYNRKYIENLMNRLYKKIKNIRIRTDIIVGFPTETEKDFKDTCSILEKIKFDRVSLFMFDSRPFTKAAKLEDLPRETKKNRLYRLNQTLGRKGVKTIVR